MYTNIFIAKNYDIHEATTYVSITLASCMLYFPNAALGVFIHREFRFTTGLDHHAFI